MLIIFTSNAHSDIMMFGDVAEKLIEMMGHSGTIPSAIAAKDVPAALEQLKKALTSHEKEMPEVKEDEDEDKEEKVNLSGRAFPLIEMLEAASRENEPVKWHKK